MSKRNTSRFDFAEMLLRQMGRCICCKTQLHRGNVVIEHVIPLALGGADTQENKELRCKDCASKKTNGPRGSHTSIDGDIHAIAKTKRLVRGPKPPGKWPKRKLTSRNTFRRSPAPPPSPQGGEG